MSDIRPFYNIGPGEMLKDDLEALGWSQEDFANITGMSLKAVNELLNDKVALTVETARLVSKAIGTSAESWLRLDAAYRLRLLEDSEREKETGLKGAVMKVMPVREMVKKGWIGPYDSAASLVKKAKDFWEEKEPDFSFLDRRPSPCFRRSREREYFEKFYAFTWLRKAETVARKMKPRPFEQERAREIGAALPDLSRATDGVSRLCDLLDQAGIGFFALSHLQKTYLDGAALWLGANPFVICTLRYDRNDNFWFTLAHELAHVALGHVRNEGDQILDELRDDAETDREKEADALAACFRRPMK
jgi:HTH-type transcriptional regulator / antitoxin HigA